MTEDRLVSTLWSLAYAQARAINEGAGELIVSPRETVEGQAALEITRLRYEVDKNRAEADRRAVQVLGL
jgi:hypothetical protein